MPLVRKNIVANLVGSGWAALMSFAFIPLYIRFMGIESYGLVGFYMTLQALMFLLDMGLTATVSRELARLTVAKDASGSMKNLVRTLEVLYWTISCLVFVIVLILSEWIAAEWIQGEQLSTSDVSEAIALIGLVIAARMPLGFYNGALVGMQHQVLMNVIRVVAETIRNGGAVLILWLISPTISWFFLWHGLVSLIAVGVTAATVWRNIPVSTNKPVFSFEILKNLWRFAAGMSAIAFVSIILAQMDKVVLSRMLSLEVFGYYTLASVVAMSLYFIVTPVVTAYAPKLTQLLTVDDQAGLVARYHQGCQLMSVLILPVALSIAFFSFDILLLWTRDIMLAEHSYMILTILVIGTALNGVMNLPYALQVSAAWTRLTLVLNSIMLVILVPALVYMTQNYGPEGAASVWLVLNAVYVLVGIHLMHRRLIPDEKWRWYIQDLLLPAAAVLAVVSAGRFVISPDTPGLGTFFSIAGTILVATLAAAAASGHIRAGLLLLLRRRLI